MAKSSLDLRGAKSPKLELDFLRLAYVVRDLRAAGGNAIGYLAVIDEKVAATALSWVEKYHSGDAVVVLVCELAVCDRDLLRSEKADNARGFLPDPEIRNLERNLAIADLGREFGERGLQKAIEERHPGILTCTKLLQSGINWDYYGTVPPKTNA
jgi:hypothetical protein